MKTILKMLVTACAVGSIAASANAAIVTDWQGTATATWISASPGVTVTPSQLSWGNDIGNGQSSLTITNLATQPVTTFIGGGNPPAAYIAAGSSLTHNNVPITNSPMTGATLRDSLTLKAINPVTGSAFGLPTIDFNIAFLETTNATPCAAASPPNNPCNDIFVLLGGFLNQTFDYDTDGAGGQAPVTYYVNIFPIAGGVLSILSDSACAAVHAANAAAPATNCFGFTTPENGNTTLSFGYTISTLPLSIPEPGTLALVGLALLGIGKSRRLTRR